MASRKCFKQGCDLEVQYICECLNPRPYSCKNHLEEHCGLSSNRKHIIDSIFLSPYLGTKDSILNFLENEKSKKDKLRAKVIEALRQKLHNSRNCLEESLKRLDSDSTITQRCIQKISQTQKISKLDQDPVLMLLTLQPDDATKGLKEMLPVSSESCDNVELFRILNEEIEEMIESFIKNKLETIIDRKFSIFENRFNDNDIAIQERFAEINNSISHRIAKDKKNILEELNIEKRIEDYEQKFNGKLDELNRSVYNINEEKRIIREINIEKRVEDYEKNFNGKLEVLNLSISHINEENDEKIKRIMQEIKNEKRFDDYEKKFNGKLEELNRLISYMNEENQKLIQELNIEKRFEEHNQHFNCKLEKMNCSISDDYKENIRKLEAWKQEISIENKENNKVVNEEIAKINISISNIKDESRNINQKFEDWMRKINIEEHDKIFAEKRAEIDDLISHMINESEENIKNFETIIKSRLEEQNKKIKAKTTENIILKIEESKSEILLKTQNEENLLSSRTTDDLKETDNLLNINIIKEKTTEMARQPNNPELEIDFRRTCSQYGRDPNALDPQLMESYQEYLSMYQKFTSLFNFLSKEGTTNLHIYNTETESKEIKNLQEFIPLERGSCITQLPNSELFIISKDKYSDLKMLIIDRNLEVSLVPPINLSEKASGTSYEPLACIYFSNNVYCFVGNGNWHVPFMNRGFRLNLHTNEWIPIAPMPRYDHWCNSAIFNGNFLISGYENRELLRYSIDADSFTTIPYKFAVKKSKILINVGRLYLIECENGSIYESGVGSDDTWRRIVKSAINFNPFQTYCSYNKEAIYIGCSQTKQISYFKFELNKKKLIQLK